MPQYEEFGRFKRSTINRQDIFLTKIFIIMAIKEMG